MRVLVVLPTYNEAENIERVLRRIRAALPDGGVLVVDDGSPDGTADMAQTLAGELGNIDVLRRADKSGLGSAYRAGFAWGLERGWEAFVEMDADLSHEPEALPSLIAPITEGVDLVVGSRYVGGGSIPNWRWHRRLLSQGGNVYAARAAGAARRRLDLRVPRIPRRCSASDRPRRRPCRGVRVSDRDGPPDPGARGPRHRGPHPLRGPGGRQVQDVHVHRGGGPGPGDVVGLQACRREPSCGVAPAAPGRRPRRRVDRLARWMVLSSENMDA